MLSYKKKINRGKMKSNFRNMKDVFVNNISSFNPMVSISIHDNYTNFGMHFYEDFFEYLHLSHFDKPVNHWPLTPNPLIPNS